jgi:Bacterial mobilisation protein (MobC)
MESDKQPKEQKAPKVPKIKPKRINLVVPADKLKIVDNHATMMGLNRSQYLIARGLKRVYVRSREVPPVEIIALIQILSELKRQGNNLNQVARSLNSGSSIDSIDLPIHLEATRLLLQLLREWQD